MVWKGVFKARNHNLYTNIKFWASYKSYKGLVVTFGSYPLAYLKYLNKYALTTNVSAYVKYVNTFACQNYLCKIVALCISTILRK